MKDLKELLAKLGIGATHLDLYEQAFTHPSVNGMIGTKHRDYERLEFLGDAVIGMTVAGLCYTLHPELQEGGLSILKNRFIRSVSEGEYAKKLGFADYIRVGESFQGTVADNQGVMEDVFESFAGALYLGEGLDAAVRFLSSLFREDVAKAKIEEEDNPKTVLQEAMQAEHKEAVEYRLLSTEGPANARQFLVAVYFENQELGRGLGHSKKAAEVAAAREALAKKASPK